MTKINWKPVKALLAKSIIALVAILVCMFCIAIIIGMFITQPVYSLIFFSVCGVVAALIWAIGYLEDYT